MKYAVLNYRDLLNNPDFRIDADYAVHPLAKGATTYKSRFLPLQDIVEYISSGHTPYRHDVSEGDVNFVTVECVGDLTLDESSLKRITKEQFNSEFKKNRVVANSILCTIKRRICKSYPFIEAPANPMAMNQDVAFLIPKKNMDAVYLATYLCCTIGQSFANRQKTEQMNPYISVANLGQLPVAMLSADFQKNIRNIFGQSLKLINRSVDVYDISEKLLLDHMKLVNWKPKHRLSFIKNFTDTQSANRIDAEYYQPMYEEIVEAIEVSKKYSRLDDIVIIKKSVEPGSESYQDIGIPFLRVSNLSKFGINTGNQQYISELLYDTLKEYQPKKGEVLLSKDASPGIAYYLKDTPGKMIPSSGVLRLTVKDGSTVQPEYLTLVLNSIIVQKQLERDAGGSIINHWLVDQVKNTLIPILPLSMQKEISKKVDESFTCREESARLLEVAKRAVEIAIENSEKEAEKWLNAELKKISY